MKVAEICKEVQELKDKYLTDSPSELCDALDINLLFQPMGIHTDAIKGFVIGVDGVFAITINSDLPENLQKIITAHELFHTLEHCINGVCGYSDTAMFDEISEMEREANFFAAELLLDDKDVLKALNDDSTFFTAAARLYVPIELLDFKFRLMKYKGYALAEPPINSHNDFLKGIKVCHEKDIC